MKKYSIANLITELDCKYDLMRSRLEPYNLTDEMNIADSDIVIDISEEMYENTLARLPQFNREECEYMLMGDSFYKQLIHFDGMLLHASAVEKDGEAFLFSAKSGTGKSTHTHLWLEYFENARIINDDKPAIRKIGEDYFAFGTPFSGKTDESVNTGVKLAAIVFLERSKTNIIKKITPAEAIPLIMNQTVRPSTSADSMNIFLNFMDGLLTKVPVYKLYCNISLDAVKTAYYAIKGETKNED